jgi:short subunit dehydrogenase-like uncharacterized protein
VGRVLASDFMQRRLRQQARERAPGPSEAARARGVSRLWAAATNPVGRQAISRLTGPEGYTLTAMTAVAAAEHVIAGRAPTGFQTPSLAYGADFVLEIEGVTRDDVV